VHVLSNHYTAFDFFLLSYLRNDERGRGTSNLHAARLEVQNRQQSFLEKSLASKERLDRLNIAKDMVALAPSWDDKNHWLKVMRECADDISRHASADRVNESFANIPALVGPSVPSAQFPGSFSILGPPFDLVALNALRTDDEMISCSSVGKGRSSTPTTRKAAQNQSGGASRKVPALTPTRKDEKKSVSSVPRKS
jgi:hypothetical protein